MIGADPARPPWTLFPEVSPAPRSVGRRINETAMSVLVRLGVANRMRDVSHLLKSTPHLRAKQVNNREHRIEVAARLAGFDADQLAADTPVRLTGSHMTVAGSTFGRRGTLPGRACPVCIEQDLDDFAHGDEALRPFRRGWWQVPAISTCPRHEVALVAVCTTCGHNLDERRPARTCRCGDLRLADVGVAPDACVHDAWLLGRLGLAPRIDAPMIDAMPPQVGSELCRVVGSSMRGETLRGAGREAAALLAETRSAGWRLLLGGQPALARVLDDIVARNRNAGSVCNTGYGSLHRFLTRETSPALDGLRNLVAEHARSNVGLSGSRARLFGRVVTGELVSVTQAAKLLDVSYELLLRILVAVAPDFSLPLTGPTLVNRAQLVAAQDAIRSSIRSSSAKAILGFEKELLRAAVDATLLEYVVPPKRAGFNLVRRHGVERLSRLFTRPAVCEREDLIDVGGLGRAAQVTNAEIMVAVARGGLLPVGRLADVDGFPALLFDPSAAHDLRIHVRGEVSRLRALTELGWMPSTISILQDAGLMEGSGPKTVVLTSLARFRDDYATAAEAGAWLSDPPSTRWALHKLLGDRCGAPAVGGRGVTAFWLRDRLLAGLAPLLPLDLKSHAIGFGSSDWIHNRGL